MRRSIPNAAAAVLLFATCGIIALFSIPSISNSQHEHSSPLAVESPPALSESLPFSAKSRRLSDALPNGGCHLTWPQKPPPGVPITYAASYPGCGARMTWNLVEALTGLWTGDDWNNNGRGDEVVTVKTHFPQSNGILVDFDERIQRGFIVIRNPMKSIPSFFNHIYEMRNHLAVHTERAPLDEWIKWRNAYLDTEIAEYKKFICYWMDRYTAENRLLMTYEGLTDDLIGAEVAKGLNDFLGQVEGVTTIDSESVPCIWRAVVKNQPPPQQAAHIKKLQSLALNQPQGQQHQAEQGSQEEGQQQGEQPQIAEQGMQQEEQPQIAEQGMQQMEQPQIAEQPGSGIYTQAQLQQHQPNLRHRRLDPGHHDSQRKGPEVPRPYTPEQLDKMMNMLLEVAERYHKEDVRLYHIMMGYYEKIRAERIKLSPEEVAKPPGEFY